MGIIVGLLIAIVPRFFLRPNILFIIIAILIASEIAHAIKLRDNAIVGSIIGAVYGVFQGVNIYYQEFYPTEQLNFWESVIVAIIGLIIAALFFAVIGWIVGRLMKLYREGHGFFF